jgi:hypothetical protein
VETPALQGMTALQDKCLNHFGWRDRHLLCIHTGTAKDMACCGSVLSETKNWQIIISENHVDLICNCGSRNPHFSYSFFTAVKFI